MASIDELAVEINFKVNEALKGLDAFQKKMEETTQKAEKSGDEMERSAKRGASSWSFFTLALTGTAKAADWFFKKLGEGRDRAVSLSNTVDKVKNSTGLTGEQFQRLDYIFKQHNGDINSLISSYQNLQNLQTNWKLYGITDQGQNLALSRLRINPYEYENTKDLLEAIVKSLLEVEDIGERNKYAASFGIDLDFLRVVAKGKYYVNDIANLTEKERQAILEWQQEMNVFYSDMDKMFTKLAAKFTEKLGLPVAKWLNKWNRTVQETLGGGEEINIDALPNLKLSKDQMQVANIVTDVLSNELPANARIAVLGSLMQESSLDPYIENAGHKGLAQWDKSRWAKFEEVAQKRGWKMGTREEMTRAQAKFIMYELKRRRYADTDDSEFDAMRYATSVANASEIFAREYEIPVSPRDPEYNKKMNEELKRRITYALQIQNQRSPLIPEIYTKGYWPFNNVLTSPSDVDNITNNNTQNSNLTINQKYTISRSSDGELIYEISDATQKAAMQGLMNK